MRLINVIYLVYESVGMTNLTVANLTETLCLYFVYYEYWYYTYAVYILIEPYNIMCLYIINLVYWITKPNTIIKSS